MNSSTSLVESPDGVTVIVFFTVPSAQTNVSVPGVVNAINHPSILRRGLQVIVVASVLASAGVTFTWTSFLPFVSFPSTVSAWAYVNAAILNYLPNDTSVSKHPVGAPVGLTVSVLPLTVAVNIVGTSPGSLTLKIQWSMTFNGEIVRVPASSPASVVMLVITIFKPFSSSPITVWVPVNVTAAILHHTHERDAYRSLYHFLSLQKYILVPAYTCGMVAAATL